MADRSVTDATLLGDWADQYNLLVADVGDKDTLTTTATTAVTAINELDGEIGTLSSLTTTATGNLVAAINEVDADVALKANIASPAFTGTPTAPTAAGGTNTTQIATTAFVTAAVTAAGGGDVSKVGTPVDNQIAVWTGANTIQGDTALTFDTTTDTLSVASNEVWHAGNDGAGSTLDADLLDGQQGSFYAPIGSPTFTGTPTAPTAATTTNTTQIASTAFVQQELNAQVHDAADVTTGTFDAARIPNLDAAKITTGSFATARIPLLDAAKIDTGTFADARIPNLATSKITSGTFADARIAASNVTQHQAALSITESQISDLGDYGAISTGTVAPVSTPTAVGDVFIDTTGDVVYVATGTASAADWLQVSGSGSVSDLSDTTISGGLTSGDFLRYNGSAWVDTPLIAADIPSLDTGKITTGTFANARISEGSVTQHEAALTILTSQLSGDVALGTGTSGNYVATVSGTSNEIEVSGGTGEGTTITVGLPNDVTIGNDLTVTGDIVAGTANARALTASLSAALTQANSANRIVTISASVAVTDDDFAAGDAIILIASGADRTITPDVNLTIKYDGATVASATIKQDGMASLVFTGANTAFLSGDISSTT
jgi:hypothetical protein